ncbi:hypothetical protein ACRDNQ_04080 [Palleronia sp. KMU-117]|uniref:hypothetical protein n=1 Tax=Palleronia sp. KMU-117 TaxID=3434108 RepID=UPI003D70E3F9
MKPDYSVTITRFAEGDDKVLVDRYITADEAIDLLLHIQEHVHGLQVEITGSQGEPTTQFAFSAVEGEEPEPAPKRKKYSKPADATEPIERLTKAGGRGTRKCSSCGQPGHTARTCSGRQTDEALTEYERRKQEKEAETTDNDPALAELDRMAAEGLSQTELGQMFPSIPIYEIIKAWERHNHL